MQAVWLTVFRYTVYATAAVGLVLTVLSLIYFNARTRALNPDHPAFAGTRSAG